MGIFQLNWSLPYMKHFMITFTYCGKIWYSLRKYFDANMILKEDQIWSLVIRGLRWSVFEVKRMLWEINEYFFFEYSLIWRLKLLKWSSFESNETGPEIAIISTFNPEDVEVESSAFNSKVFSFLLNFSFPKRWLSVLTINSGLKTIITLTIQIRNNVIKINSRYFDWSLFNLNFA